MKKFLFFILCVLVMLFVQPLNAQLRVDSVGRINISNSVGVMTSPANNVGIYFEKEFLATGHYMGIKSVIKNKRGFPYAPKTFVGVLGVVQTDSATTNFSKGHDHSILVYRLGVAGLSNDGVGIYGGNTSELPTNVAGVYAGYFDGDVKVNGTLTATIVTTTSDYRLKQNIQELNTIINKVSQLHPISYNFRQDTINFSCSKNAQEINNFHYGLVAQEVQKVLPNIVYENQDGYLSINYTELVPLLIQSVKELKEENNKQNDIIESLRLQINQQSNNPSKVKGKSEFSDEMEAKLYQNQPNPFSQSTEISYSLPFTTQSATLYVYDMSGVQLRSYSISQFGESSITIKANDLSAGMYLYSLVADGEVIDTKQ